MRVQLLGSGYAVEWGDLVLCPHMFSKIRNRTLHSKNLYSSDLSMLSGSECFKISQNPKSDILTIIFWYFLFPLQSLIMGQNSRPEQ